MGFVRQQITSGIILLIFFISLFVAKNISGVSLCSFGAPKSLSMQDQDQCPSPLEDASKEAPKLSG